jgi:hypothetical protein
MLSGVHSCLHAVASMAFAITPAMALLPQAPPSPSSDKEVLSEFTKKAKDYVSQEHTLAIEKMKPTSDVVKLNEQRKQLREAMQHSRSDAKQGDFFTPEASKLFRKLLSGVLKGEAKEKVRSSLSHAEPTASASFRVNAEFPNQAGQPIQSVPPSVLKVLPALPEELEYRIAGNTLALRDSRANMVVDYLPNALP